MIYLIGGAPRVGKSTLARKIAEEKHAKVIELDGLMRGWNTQLPAHEHADRLPVWQAKKEGRPPEVDDYLTEAKTYWPMIRARIVSALGQSGDWVIEGSQLNPMLLRQWLQALDPSEAVQIQVMFLHDPESPHPLSKLILSAAHDAGFAVYERDAALDAFKIGE